MKQNHCMFTAWHSTAMGFLFISLIMSLVARMKADESKTNNYENIIYHNAAVTPDDIVASINIDIASPENTNADVSQTYLEWDRVSTAWEIQQIDLVRHLTKVLYDSKSANLNKCSAAYYLAAIRPPIPMAIDALAANITLQCEGRGSPPHRFPKMLPGEYMSVFALEKIGNLSIPAMIRNLAESDDAKVRELSLQVLFRIDGDKDIVQLRLQKALNAEKNSERQARLQSALKALGETKF